jgi:transcriptional regulator with XRE-family HTH domain
MLPSSQAFLPTTPMSHDEQQFFKELGARIAQLRKDAGLSQQAVADALELAQQTYANYEVARARPPVSMLPTLAELFGVSVDEILGLHKNGTGKRGPAPLLQKQIERLNRLPKAQQKVVLKMLEGVLSQPGR